jgi:alkylhydroperoxidase family enzyme
MARVPLPTPEALSGAPREVYDRIAARRGVPVENVFLALVNTPDLADGVLGLASALRASTALPRPLRELAVVTVGLETGAEYEVNHHWNAALKAGVRREQLEALSEYEGSDVFSPQERAVIRFAREVTRHGRIDQDVWDGLGGLDLQQQMELVLTVAWYNCVVRILLPLDIEIEDWFRRN